MNRKKLIVVSILLGLTVAVPGVPGAFAKNPNPGVLPPQSHAFGMTYGEWSAAWWQWAFSLPTDHHPLFDTADCSAGQSGKVFFLGGTFVTTMNPSGTIVGVANRNCTVPAGKALFFPIINTECSTLEGNGTTDAALRECAEFFQDHAIDLEGTIDGVPLQNLESYRVQSPLFTYGPLPNKNVLQSFGVNAPAGATSPAVADGVYLLLAPLSVGNHTLHFSGDQSFSIAAGDPFDFEFELDVTYNLTVAPRRP
jgi:hypothetical protein